MVSSGGASLRDGRGQKDRCFDDPNVDTPLATPGRRASLLSHGVDSGPPTDRFRDTLNERSPSRKGNEDRIDAQRKTPITPKRPEAGLPGFAEALESRHGSFTRRYGVASRGLEAARRYGLHPHRRGLPFSCNPSDNAEISSYGKNESARGSKNLGFTAAFGTTAGGFDPWLARETFRPWRVKERRAQSASRARAPSRLSEYDSHLSRDSSRSGGSNGFDIGCSNEGLSDYGGRGIHGRDGFDRRSGVVAPGTPRRLGSAPSRTRHGGRVGGVGGGVSRPKDIKELIPAQRADCADPFDDVAQVRLDLEKFEERVSGARRRRPATAR